MADSLQSMSDGELLALATNLHTTIQILPGNYGQTTGFVLQLDDSIGKFTDALNEHVTAQATAKSKTAAKELERDTLELLVRDARTAAKAAKIGEVEYNQLGIPTSSNPAPSNATIPAANVDTSERMRHTISWTDAAANGNKKKPRGAMGAEIWVKVGSPAPGSEKDCVFLTLDAFTPYVSEYTADDTGKVAHYMLRWRMRDGSVSAWGETVSATITA